jgi:hypothetical protein
VSLEQRADGRGGESLAERRDDAASHEDVFHRARFSIGNACLGLLTADVRREQATDLL